MSKILVSKCLLGEKCRYDGKVMCFDNVIKKIKGHEVFVVCPEMDGGLLCPRPPAERIGEKIIANNGVDVTQEYMRGAQIALQTAKENEVDFCILKSRSPSCGNCQIYDGTFSGKIIDGMGVTSELLKKNGFLVLNEEEI